MQKLQHFSIRRLFETDFFIVSMKSHDDVSEVSLFEVNTKAGESFFQYQSVPLSADAAVICARALAEIAGFVYELDHDDTNKE